MPTKVLTYFAQNTAIDELCNKYGSQLQKLDRTERLAMLAVCARVLYVGQLEGCDTYSIEEELTLPEYAELSAVVKEDIITLDGSTEDEIEGFCMGLLDSLK